MSSTQMERPQSEGYTVYTKENCKYCRKVKQLLPHGTKYVPCDELIQRDRDGFLAAMDTIAGKQHRTFPFVFHNGQFVGGCDDTEMHVGLSCTNF